MSSTLGTVPPAPVDPGRWRTAFQAHNEAGRSNLTRANTTVVSTLEVRKNATATSKTSTAPTASLAHGRTLSDASLGRHRAVDLDQNARETASSRMGPQSNWFAQSPPRSGLNPKSAHAWPLAPSPTERMKANTSLGAPDTLPASIAASSSHTTYCFQRPLARAESRKSSTSGTLNQSGFSPGVRNLWTEGIPAHEPYGARPGGSTHFSNRMADDCGLHKAHPVSPNPPVSRHANRRQSSNWGRNQWWERREADESTQARLGDLNRSVSGNPNLGNEQRTPRSMVPPVSSSTGSSTQQATGSWPLWTAPRPLANPSAVGVDDVSDTWSNKSEWEQPPPGIMDPPTPTPRSLDLPRVADNASVLLELFSRTLPANDKDISIEYRVMINTALDWILKIHRRLRVLAAEGDHIDVPLDEEVDDTKVDAACIICYARIADTVILPCGHLVLCMVCYGRTLVGLAWC